MKLLKFILLAFILFIISLYSISSSFKVWEDPNEKLYTNKEQNSVVMEGNSLEGWADQTSLWVQGVAKKGWSDEEATIDYISGWVSYFIWILAIIVLFLLVYNWIVMITAWWDEEKYSNWLKNLRNYAIWLIFIGLVWLFVMLIFYVIRWFYYAGT